MLLRTAYCNVSLFPDMAPRHFPSTVWCWRLLTLDLPQDERTIPFMLSVVSQLWFGLSAATFRTWQLLTELQAVVNFSWGFSWGKEKITVFQQPHIAAMAQRHMLTNTKHTVFLLPSYRTHLSADLYRQQSVWQPPMLCLAIRAKTHIRSVSILLVARRNSIFQNPHMVLTT